jgi:hypothetical protein
LQEKGKYCITLVYQTVIYKSKLLVLKTSKASVQAGQALSLTFYYQRLKLGRFLADTNQLTKE